MNTHRIILIMAASFATIVNAEDISVNQLPVAVKRTLEQEAKNDPVKKIKQVVMDGRTIYLVEVEKKNAINPRLRIAEDGELLPISSVPVSPDGMTLGPDPLAPTGSYDSVVSFDQLPEPVQRTIRNESRGREIADIDRESWKGQTVYEVEFRAEGRNPQIHVAEDGSIVRGEASRGRLSEFFLGTQLSDTPPAVQETIRREAGGRVINDIDVERRTGEVVYEVEINDPQSGIFQLHVAADGRILKDSRASASQSSR